MNDELLKSLLFEDEGAALDFKEQQYPFSGASEDAKSEILKDVLAMANAWRTGDGHILIGVREVRGGESEVLGETAHPLEHTLQQFINSKTNRPVDFSYQVYDYSGSQIGIIRIPRQPRPLYARKTYGHVQGEVVYLRRGSATVVATPDEVADMGREGRDTARQPSLELQWANLHPRQALQTHVSAKRVKLLPMIDPNALRPRTSGPFQLASGILTPNPSFYEEAVDYVYQRALMMPVGLMVQHVGGPAAREVELVLTIDRHQSTTVVVKSERDMPDMPSQSILANVRPIESFMHHRRTEARADDVCWTVSEEIGQVSAGRRRWTTQPIYIGALETCSVSVVGQVFADNLLAPLTFDLRLDLEVIERAMTIDDVRPLLE